LTDAIQVPFHTCVYSSGSGLVEAYFYKVDDEFKLVLRAQNSPPSPGGTWSSFGEAYDAGRSLAEGLSPRVDRARDPIERWRKPGASFVAIRDIDADEWLVITSRGNSIVDTGFRSKDEAEARKVASGKP
jgi:hypothetical protein